MKNWENNFIRRRVFARFEFLEFGVEDLESCGFVLRFTTADLQE